MAIVFQITRVKELEARKKFPWLYKEKHYDDIEIFDQLSPGWQRAKAHWIYGTPSRPDLVYELPGRIFIRGWDFTGAICRKQVRKQARVQKQVATPRDGGARRAGGKTKRITSRTGRKTKRKSRSRTGTRVLGPHKRGFVTG